MLYYLIITYYTFTATPTENPTIFEVQAREVTDTRLLLNREEAYTQYYKELALRPYKREYLRVELDSASICPAPITKKKK